DAEERVTIANAFRSFENNYFQVFRGAIGAIDGSHIPMVGDRVPHEVQNQYHNRKGWYSILAQGVVDHLMRYRDVYVGVPGSCHDSYQLKKSPLWTSPKEALFSAGQYLLGDAAYPLLSWLLAALKDNAHWTEAMNKFQGAHSALRIKVECSFGMLKNRF